MISRSLTGLCLALGLLLSACEVDLRNQSSFEAFEDGRFRYGSFADRGWPEGSENAEAARIKVLRETLAANSLCPSGYTITERKAFRKSDLIYDLVYYGHCT